MHKGCKEGGCLVKLEDVVDGVDAGGSEGGRMPLLAALCMRLLMDCRHGMCLIGADVA